MHRIRRVFVLAAVAMLAPACGGGGGSSGDGGSPAGGGQGNPEQSSLITTPTSGSSFAEGTDIQIEVADSGTTAPSGAGAAKDSTVRLDLQRLADEPAVKVDFYQDAALIGTSSVAPFGLLLQGATPGIHTLSVVTTDAAGVATASTPVQVEVVATDLVSQRWLRLDSGRTDPLNGVFFTDPNNGWVVGGNGTILHTADGGATWAAQASGTTSTLNRVQFVSPTRGWAVGSQGAILSTSDGGQTWSAQSSGSTAFLVGLSFVSAGTGWAVGSGATILKTTDGGALWTTLPPPTTNPGPEGETYKSVSFVSATKGWMAGGGFILSTFDGGATWSRQIFIDPRPGVYPFTFLFNDLRFMSELRGTVVGATHYGNVILTTADGGATWTTHRQDSLAPHFGGVTFGDGLHLWAVGSEGIISASSDGGITWVTQSSPTYESLQGVWFVDANNGWVVGSGGTILKTTTGGRAGP